MLRRRVEHRTPGAGDVVGASADDDDDERSGDDDGEPAGEDADDSVGIPAQATMQGMTPR